MGSTPLKPSIPKHPQLTHLSPTITVSSGLIPNLRMAYSNIGAFGLPSTTGVRPDTVLIIATEQPAPEMKMAITVYFLYNFLGLDRWLTLDWSESKQIR